MDLDILIINGRHFTSKKDNKVYNCIDCILLSKDSYIDNEKFKGYSVATCFFDENILPQLKIYEPCKGHFSNKVNGLKSSVKLEKITYKDGTTISLV